MKRDNDDLYNDFFIADGHSLNVCPSKHLCHPDMTSERGWCIRSKHSSDTRHKCGLCGEWYPEPLVSPCGKKKPRLSSNKLVVRLVPFDGMTHAEILLLIENQISVYEVLRERYPCRYREFGHKIDALINLMALLMSQ